MMNTNCQKHGVHDLTQEELDDVIIETFSQKDDSIEPGQHIDSIGEDVMFQENVSHHEN